TRKDRAPAARNGLTCTRSYTTNSAANFGNGLASPARARKVRATVAGTMASSVVWRCSRPPPRRGAQRHRHRSKRERGTMASPAPVLERPSKPQTEESLALRLSDSQLDAVMRLCRPLAPPCRDVLLRILAHELRGRRDVGDGELHRLARRIITDNNLFDPPLKTYPPLHIGNGRSK